MNGVLPIDKPRGMTSHDVVAWVRRVVRQRRVGHAGTLDPIATGVLLLCLGEATRLSDQLMAGVKWYLARIAFGAVSDTDDADGRLLARSTPPPLADALHSALTAQVGALQQLPPRFAAIKLGGVPAYQSARAGETPALSTRPVSIYALAVLDIGLSDFTLQAETGDECVPLPFADLVVCCSKGTYIRALARDLGQSLGCGALMAALRRIASGTFTSGQCISPDELERRVTEGGADALHRLVLPMDAAVASLPAAVLDEIAATRAARGQSVPLPATPNGGPLRLYRPEGSLLGLAARAGGAGLWHPDIVFSPDSFAPTGDLLGAGPGARQD